MKLYQLSTGTFSMFVATAGLVFAINSVSAKNYNESRTNTAAQAIPCPCVVDNDQLPGNGTEWVGEGPAEEWLIPGNAIREQGIILTALGGESPTMLPDGSWQVDSFFDITYRIDFQVNGGPVTPSLGSGTVQLMGTAPPSAPGDLVRTFDMEVLSLDLSGLLENDPNQPFLLRESPTLPSLGQTTIVELGGGMFEIDSFFDVFTELSLDGGQTWTAAVAQVPEPSSLLTLLVATTVMTVIAPHRRARKRHLG